MDIFAICNRTGKFVPQPGNWTAVNLTEAKPHFTYFVYAIERQIYLYTFCSVTVYLAFVILFSYVATVTVHMLIILFGRKWTSRAWPGLGEFLVLTLHSPPCVTPTGADMLTGSGGVDSAKTWTLQATVRKLGHGNRIGLIVEKPNWRDDDNDNNLILVSINCVSEQIGVASGSISLATEGVKQAVITDSCCMSFSMLTRGKLPEGTQRQAPIAESVEGV
ncbi:hypothetical protein TruAng_010295 [Truncatella angustata]|nr:hypothetical protein TruAng_010295 [Truncatella angustata]